LDQIFLNNRIRLLQELNLLPLTVLISHNTKRFPTNRLVNIRSRKPRPKYDFTIRVLSFNSRVLGDL
jgi:hypothetical protein